MITVNFNSIIDISDEQFYQLCIHNPETQFERNSDGEIIIMPPTGGETGKRNTELIVQLAIWNRQTKLGQVFDSSTGYKLPSGANRSPDVSWIKQERWDALTNEQKAKFIPLAPDFALELMSPTDYLVNTQAKMTSDPASSEGARASVRLNRERARMREYLENQVQLGWLINPQAKQVEIYRLGQDVELLDAPPSISAGEILPGFVLDLADIF
jgi:Uma2 family endonuclease